MSSSSTFFYGVTRAPMRTILKYDEIMMKYGTFHSIIVRIVRNCSQLATIGTET